MMNILSFVLQSINEKTVVFFLRSHWYECILGLFKDYEKPSLSFSFIFSHGLSFSENFSSQTIDLGVVVTDIDKSLEFYKDVVGFSEKDGFEVKGDFPKKVGLTDGTPLKIHVLTLGDEEKATKLKLMQVASQKPARKIKQPFIHTLAGFSYLTIFVNDVDLVMKNAQRKD